MNKTILLGTVLLAACASGGLGNTSSSPPESASGDVLPRLVNKEFFERLMEREYSEELRRGGIEGATAVWVSLDAEGVVQDVSVKDGSGYAALDAIALRISRQLRFTPALNNGKALPVKIAFTVTFSTRDSPVPVSAT